MLALYAAIAIVSVAPPIRLGTYAYPKFDRRQALAPLAAHLSEQLGRRTEIILVESPDELGLAIQQRKVDVAVTNLATFLTVAEDRRIEPIAMLAVPPQTLAGYRGVLVARAEAGVRSFADLAENEARLRYVEVLPGSTSGALVQRRAMEGQNVAWKCFISLPPAGTHEGALEQLSSARADVAAFAEEPWRRLQAADPAAAAKLVPLWTSRPLPPGPIVCVRGVAVPCGRIQRAMLRWTGRSQRAAKALALGWTETAGAHRFVPVGSTFRALTSQQRIQIHRTHC